MLLTAVSLNLSIYFSVIHTTLWSFPLMNSRLIFTPPCLTLTLTSNIYTLLTSSHFPGFHFFRSYTNITYVTTHHTRTLYFFPYMVFECPHNIRNQPVSTAIPSPNSFRDITSIGAHHYLGMILRHFSRFFKTVDFSLG